MMIGASLLTILLAHVDVLVGLHDLLYPGDRDLLLLEIVEVRLELAHLLERAVEQLLGLLDVLLVVLVTSPGASR